MEGKISHLSDILYSGVLKNRPPPSGWQLYPISVSTRMEKNDHYDESRKNPIQKRVLITHLHRLYDCGWQFYDLGLATAYDFNTADFNVLKFLNYISQVAGRLHIELCRVAVSLPDKQSDLDLSSESLDRSYEIINDEETGIAIGSTIVCRVSAAQNDRN